MVCKIVFDVAVYTIVMVFPGVCVCVCVCVCVRCRRHLTHTLTQCHIHKVIPTLNIKLITDQCYVVTQRYILCQPVTVYFSYEIMHNYGRCHFTFQNKSLLSHVACICLVCGSFWTAILFSFFAITLSYVVGSKSFRPDIQKPRQMENAVKDIQCHLW